jgi:hypothetical protein
MIFVFGSNEKGIHGAGAAKVARQKFGAVLHQGFGPQGQSFGIPTCAAPVGDPGWEISLGKIAYYIKAFIVYAELHPELEFQVTQIGCGYVGFFPEHIAPLFAAAPKNCLFDTEWKSILGDGFRYWGHV